MIDRRARDEMARAIERYLNEELTAFDFDEALSEIATEDETVCSIRIALWGLYDDNRNHLIVATKEEWDCIHRIPLILISNAHIQPTERRRWTVRQSTAACFLALYSVVAWSVGFGGPLLFVNIAFGVVSMGLAYWHYYLAPSPGDRKRWSLEPFASVSELLTVRKTVRDFSKRKYPARLKSRTIRSPFLNAAMLVAFVGLPALPFWLLLSPAVLLWQAMPEVYLVSGVVMPNQRVA
jgi:hypothetical protein